MRHLKLLCDETSELVDMTHYGKIIGSLMYLANTRTDICFVVNSLIEYLVKPRWVRLISVKHVMRYLKGTIDLGLYYGGDHDYNLHGYTDSDWVGSATDRKITSSGCYCLGSTMISWFSKKLSSISLSTAKADYTASFSACCEATWLRKLMSRIFDMEVDTIVIFCDNHICIKMIENPVSHDKSKHIEI